MKTWLLLIGSSGLFGLSLAFRPAEPNKEPQTRAQLGEQLFFDPILSSDRTISCASCHKPEFAFADTATLSRGVNGQLTDRNTPSAMNLAAGLPEQTNSFILGWACVVLRNAGSSADCCPYRNEPAHRRVGPPFRFVGW